MAARDDDVSNQLKLTQQLAKLANDMLATNMRLEQSYKSQFDLLGSITKVQMKREGEDTQWIDELVEKVEKSAKASRDFNEALSKQRKTTKGTATQTEMFAKALAKTGKQVGVTAAFVSGLAQGFKNVTAVSKSAIGVLGSVASGIFEIGAAIIAIPLKIFSRFVDLAGSADGGMNELAEAVRKMRMEFGSLAGPTNKSIIEVSKSMKGFSETGLSSYRVFGMFAQRLEYMVELAKEMGPTFNMFTNEFRTNGGALLAYQKGLGLSGEQMAAFGNLAVANGAKIADVFKDTTKYTYELGTAFKLDAKLISKDMGKALIDVKHFAGSTVKQIAEASVYARKLGLELDKITGTLDAFETFDSAAENAAKLSQSFGVTVDAFKLMEAQDPAAQVEMLRKSLFATGKSAESMSRQELKLLAQTTGLDEATAKMAFSARNQGMSLDEIKKKGGDAAAKTLTQAEAMKKLADAIERLVMSGMTQHGGFLDQFIKGIFRGMQSTAEFRRAIWNVKLGLQQVMFEGVKLGRALVDVIPGLKDFLVGLGDLFEPSKYRKFAAGARVALVGFFKDLSDPGSKHSFSTLMENLRKHFFSFFDSQSPAGQKLLTGFKQMFTAFSRITAQGITWVSDRIAEGIKALVDIIQHPEKLSTLGKGGAAGASWVANAMQPILSSLVHAFKAIEPQLESLFKVLFAKVVDIIKNNAPLLKDAGWSAILVMFGPAVIRGALAAITGSIVTSLIGGLGKAFSGAAVSQAGGFMSSAVTRIGSLFGGAVGAIAGPAIIAAASVFVYNEGKKLIDKVFDEQKANVANLQAASFAAANAMGANVSIEDKKKQVADLQKQIEEGKNKMTHKGFFAGILTNSDEEFAHLQELQKQYEKLQAEIITGVGAPKPSEDMKKRAEGMGFLGAVNVEDAGAKLAALQKLAQKAAGKDFNVEKTLDAMREKFANVNFNVISGEQAAQLEASSKSLAQVQDIAKVATDTLATLAGLSNVKAVKLPADFTSNISNVVFGISGMISSMSMSLTNIDTITMVKNNISHVQGLISNVVDVQKSAMEIKSNGIKPALVAIDEMLKVATELDKMLGDSKLNKINISTKLQNVAKAVGFGSKGSYSVRNHDVVVTVNLDVHMDAAELEKSMIMRASSFVRQRLDYLAGEAGAGPKINEGAQYTPSNGQPPALRKIGGVAQ